MRIVDAHDKNDTASISSGRDVIKAVIGDPSLSVMIVRGNSTEVSQFVDLAELIGRPGERCCPLCSWPVVQSVPRP